MKKMTSINIDKWRTLTEELFKGYVLTYSKLSKDSKLDPAETLIKVFESLGIKGALTENNYGSAYTIAREIGVYYEENRKFVLSNMAQAYLNDKLTYSDYLKYYCLNIEFLINGEVVHPFYEVLKVLKENEFDRNNIASRVSKLISNTNDQSSIDCLRLFLNRCVDAGLLKNKKGVYSLQYNYNILLGSINVSNYSALKFENTFIKGDQTIAQKRIVKELLEREIPNLFKDSFLINKSLYKENNSLNKEEKKIDIIELFIDWFIKRDEIKNNYYSNNFSKNRKKLKEALEEYQEEYYSDFNDKVFTIDENQTDSKIKAIEVNLKKIKGNFYDYSSKKSNHMPRAILGKNNYLKFLKEYDFSKINIEQKEFNISVFEAVCEKSGLIYSDQLITRFISSLATKPFVLLSGLSGSGKTKLAEAFVKWISESKDQYCIVPVGADWTNREPLLGYPNALDPDDYVKPDNGVIDLMIEAEENPSLPYFLVLDEMNLSHVERYFADFLSVMESNEEIPLHDGVENKNGVPPKLKLPSNLFIIGTVNIDETTNMFSPKVLDRANTIEFRIDEGEMEGFLGSMKELDMEKLYMKGVNMAEDFVSLSKNKSFETEDIDDINSALLQFFGELKKTGAEFGYRTATEIMRLIHQLTKLEQNKNAKDRMSANEKIDIAIMQKLLPKLHGSRRKLSPILETLGGFCVVDEKNIVKNVFENDDYNFNNGAVVKYPLSLEKISRMYNGAIDNGFTSFAEA